MNSATGTSKNVGRFYDFSISDVLKEAWEKVKGAKATIWGAIGYIILISLVFGILNVIFKYVFPTDYGKWIEGILQIISSVIVIPLGVGCSYLGARRSVNLPIKSKLIFSMFDYFWRLIGMAVLQYIFIFLGAFLIAMLFIFLPGELSLIPLILVRSLQVLGIVFVIYIIMTFYFAYLLIVDKKMGIWEAYVNSFKAFNQHWIKIPVTIFCMVIIYLISIIPFGIGLIWTAPMMVNLNGILYREAFGVETSNYPQV